MEVQINKPSAMDCTVLPPNDADALVRLQPRRYSKKQRFVNLTMIRVSSSTGGLLDDYVLAIDTKTGKLCIERRLENILFDIERPPAPVKEKEKEKKNVKSEV